MAKWQELANIDINKISKMSRRDLAKTVSALASVGDKRIKRFNANQAKHGGADSPAIAQNKKNGGNFSVAGKTVNQLRAEFRRVSNFLNAKTSTAKGWKDTKREFKDRLNFQGLDDDRIDEFWSAYAKLQELNQGFLSSKDFDSLQLQKFIRDEMNAGGNEETVLNNALTMMENMYDIEAEADAKRAAEYENRLSGAFNGGENL